MPVWAKIDTGFHRNPKVRRAGSDGREVFLFLLLVNREHGFDGKIPPRYVEDAYLARELQWGRASRALKATQRCADAGLIAVHGLSSGVDPVSNFVELCGWDVEWRTNSDESRERVRKFRSKATESQGAVTVGNGVTPSEKSRVEQSREEAAAAAPEVSGEVILETKAPKRSRSEPSGDHARFIARFEALYLAETGAKPTWDGKAGRWVSELLRAHAFVELERRLVAMYALPADHWLRRDGALTLGAFRQHVDLFAKAATPRAGPNGRSNGRDADLGSEGLRELTEHLRRNGQ